MFAFSRCKLFHKIDEEPGMISFLMCFSLRFPSRTVFISRDRRLSVTSAQEGTLRTPPRLASPVLSCALFFHAPALLSIYAPQCIWFCNSSGLLLLVLILKHRLNFLSKTDVYSVHVRVRCRSARRVIFIKRQN